MSATVGDVMAGGPLRTASDREPKFFEIAYTLGASGDPAAGTLLKKSDTGLTLTRTGAGLFTFVAPAFPANCQAIIGYSSIQAAPTVGDMVCLTQVNSTGTFTLRFFGNALGTPVDFSTGDQLTVWAWLESKTGK